MTPPYVNRVHLQGVVSSHPILKALTATTNFTTFEVSLVESWANADGTQRARKNRVVVEVVGRDSAMALELARVGAWVTIEGYIRSEIFKGETLMKVRTLTIEVWEAHIGPRAPS